MNTLRKIHRLLTGEQRRAAVILLGLMLIGMVLETIGIGLVVPALAAMTQDNIVTRYPWLAPLMARLGNPDRMHVVVGGVICLVVVYVVKTLFLSALAWWQMRFVNTVQADLSRRMFRGYLLQPYTFHLERNSAQLIRNAMGDTSIFTQTGLMAGLALLTELFVVIGIVALLVAVEPLGALLAVAILALPAWVFHRATDRRILQWGKARQTHEGMRIQHLQQGLGGVKEVKLLGREQDFLAQYDVHNRGVARVTERQQTLQQLPRLGFELFAVLGLAALVMVMVGQNKPVEALIPTLGLFAAAAFRVLPSANRVVNSIQNVRYALPVIDALCAELSALREYHEQAPAAGRTEFAQSIKLAHVRFAYPSSAKIALDDVSIEIPQGASVGFVGGSGAGKSTLVDIVLGLLEPDVGAVLVDGRSIRENLRGWQDNIGYVPQTIFLTDDTLRRNVAFGLSDAQIDDAAVWRALRAAQLQHYVESLPQGLETTVGERGVRLSGGQLQRIGIARALYHDPPVLVLDEATSSLDVDTERGVMDAVRSLQGKKTIIIVAHRLSTVEYCNHLFRLQDGRIVNAGVPADVLADSRKIQPVTR